MLADPFVLHLNLSRGLQDGEHLSVAEAAIYLTGAKTNSDIDAAERGEAKQRQCKYFKRSLPLHHC